MKFCKKDNHFPTWMIAFKHILTNYKILEKAVWTSEIAELILLYFKSILSGKRMSEGSLVYITTVT